MDYYSAYGAALAVLLILDLFWIRVIAREFYRRNIGSFLRDSPRLGPAFAFYTIYVIALIYFVVVPYASHHNMVTLILSGAFFGAVAYGTYDMTNYALLDGWPLNVTIADIIWGGFVSASSCIAGSMFI